MKTFDEYVELAAQAHGHICAGQILGLRLALFGCRLLGIDDPTGKDRKRLVTYVEIDRCATDAITVVTGCRLGKRALKFRDFGKMAATFCDLQSNRAVRVAALESSKQKAREMFPEIAGKNEQQMRAYREMPDSSLFQHQWVRVTVEPHDLPGFKGPRITCSKCGEGINFRREVVRGERALPRLRGGKLLPARVIRCYITDRKQMGGIEPLIDRVARHLEAGVDYLQVREKDLSGRELLALARRITDLPNPKGTRVLINSRVDIALAAGAHGVHLPADSPPVSELRRIVPEGFVIGVSCHTLSELEAAQREGADFAVYGPIHAPRSKTIHGAPLGVEALALACRRVRLPVLALGGITAESIPPFAKPGQRGLRRFLSFRPRK